MPEQKKLTFPVLHMNGTSYTSLYEGYCYAAAAIRAAKAKLIDAAPNARDYYPLGDDAYEQAREEHEARLLSMDSILEEVYAILENLSDQNDARS